MEVMKWFILFWLICGVISFISGSVRHGAVSGSPFFVMYVICAGPIGLVIQIKEILRERRGVR